MSAGDFGRRLVAILGVPSLFGRRQLLLQLVVVHLVEALRDPLGCAAVVDKDDGGAVLPHQAQQLGVDRRPDRAGVGRGVERGLDRAGVDPLRRMLQIGMRRLAGVGAVAPLVGERARLDHVLDRHDDLEVELLGLRGVDDLALAAGPDEEVADPLERPLRRGEPDPLHGLLAEVVEALQREREVGPSLGGRHRVDLVHDHRLDPAEDLARSRADHQIERLGRGDQDVRRFAAHPPTLGLRRVARAQRHRDRRADPLQRRPQIALDVVGERLEGRDVDDAHARAEPLGLAREAVDAPEERRQGLTGARRGADQRVIPGGDRRPAGRLGGRGGLERRLEPLPDRLGEGLQG